MQPFQRTAAVFDIDDSLLDGNAGTIFTWFLYSNREMSPAVRSQVPRALYDYARKLAVNLYSCVNAPTQFAGLAALTGPQDASIRMVAEFDKRRKVVVEGPPAAVRVSSIRRLPIPWPWQALSTARSER